MGIQIFKDGTPYITLINFYEECQNQLHGEWQIINYIDGIRCIRNNNGRVSNSKGRKVHKLENLNLNDCIFFYKSHKKSKLLLNPHYDKMQPTQDMIYSLIPIDPRIYVGTITNPTIDDINLIVEDAEKNGFKGIILKQGFIWYEVSLTKYLDAKIINILPQKNNESKARKLITNIGTIIIKGVAENSSMTKPTVGELLTDLITNKDQYIGKKVQLSYNKICTEGELIHATIVKIYDDNIK